MTPVARSADLACVDVPRRAERTLCSFWHVPYGGTAPLLQAQLSQQLDCSINVLSTVEPHIRNGALRLLGVAIPQRLTEFPDVPTFKENGVDVARGPWVGTMTPTAWPSPTSLLRWSWASES